MTVNGQEVTHEIEPRLLLVHFLRDTLELHGTHWGCDTSNCGACTVLMDGEPVKSCTVLAAMAGGHEIATIEGMEKDGVRDPLQVGVKEDPRFIRGKGNYVVDVRLPGMLYGAVLRSPVAHANIKSIDTSAALQHPKVHAVITGKDLDAQGLAWAPTLSADVQAVLALDKVCFQGQEVAFVVADDHYSARDALELIDVDYELLPAVVNARKALDPDAPVIRPDIEGKADNHIFDWYAGDKDATDAVFEKADVVVEQDMIYPRVHPAPMETCGCVAQFDPVDSQLNLWCTTQAPHAHRTLYALVAGLPEHTIRVISPDIGGGFGNKVGIYPGYVCAGVASIVTGKPIKWMEDRSENLTSTAFARDYIMRGEIAATKEGKMLGIRINVIADHGAFNATAQPTKYPAGFFHIFTGSYDWEAAHCAVTGDYPTAMQKALDMAGYQELLAEQAEKRERGELMGIGVSFFTETVGAGPRKDMDIAGLGMADGADLRVHPTGKAVLGVSCQSQGQGHETTFAQIVAEELGIPPEDIEVVHGDTDR